MEILFPIVAFLLCLAATYGSLGWGFASVFAVGYFSGVIRANYIGVYTTFMFDLALLGLYLGFVMSRSHELHEMWERPSGWWMLALIGWPICLALLPINDYLIQVAALRGTVFFLPAFFVATRLTAAEVANLARAVALLNLCAFAGGVYVYLNGVESLYPRNAITQIIYNSADAGGGHHRVPSTFLSAHSYGGTMLYSMVLLVDRSFGPNVGKLDRTLAALGVAAAIAGILMCSARSPIVLFGVATLIAWICTRFNPVVGMVAAGLTLAGFGIALSNERFQRALSLDDTEAVTGRIRVSANERFLELAVQYPIGAGMGSSAGTPIPYFLADRAPVPIGMENEYCRILIDQGWLGLVLWGGFLYWLFSRPPPLRLEAPWGIGVVLAYSLCLTSWLTGFIGLGLLASIPGSVLMLMLMGILARIREQADEEAVCDRDVDAS
jgi:hypothetical protein